VQDPYLKSVLEVIESEVLNWKGPHLITVDELGAAGALDVPPAWRKSLSARVARVERDLFFGLSDDDDPRPAVEQPAPSESDGEPPAAEEPAA
jgi:hypothetical protein